MKLFNKTIDRELFKQYPLGSDLSKQEVVVKIFNPQGRGNWFILNSDPQDPDYLWAIVDLGYGAEVGSVSRSDLETYRGKFGLGFERDLGFDPINAEELYNGLRQGKFYAEGGEIKNKYKSYNDFVNKNIGKDKIVISVGSGGQSQPLGGATEESIEKQFKQLVIDNFTDYEFSANYISQDLFKEYNSFVEKFYNSLIENPKEFIQFWNEFIIESGRYDSIYAIRPAIYDEKGKYIERREWVDDKWVKNYVPHYPDLIFSKYKKNMSSKLIKEYQDYLEEYAGDKIGYNFSEGGNLGQSLEDVLKQNITFLKFDSNRAYGKFSRLEIPFINVHDYDFNHYCIIETKNLEKVLDTINKGVRVVKKKFESDDLGFDYKGSTSFAEGGLFQPLSIQKQEERQKLKENIIKALFVDKKNPITEVALTYSNSEYSVPNINKQDIRNMVLEINKTKKYKNIIVYINSYGVLSLKVENNFAEGGNIENFSDNQRMIMNQNVELEHHHEELEDILEDEIEIPAWVVAKMATATQSVSDVTHYLDGQKELIEDEQEDEKEEDEQEYGEFDYSNLDPTGASSINVVEPINANSEIKAEMAKKFTEDALGNLKGFLQGMNEIELRDDYTFDYNNEQFEIEPIINSDQKSVSNAVFTIFDGDGEQQGEIIYSSDGGKQKFTANSKLFGWNKTKFEDGGFMNGVYANGGYFDGTIPNVSTYMSNYAEGGNVPKNVVIQSGGKGDFEVWHIIDAKSPFSITTEIFFDSKEEAEKFANKKGFNIVTDFENEYANGGEITQAEILGFSRNIMGTTDIEMKIAGMRKAQDFSVYPIGKDDAGSVITIQSGTRIGQINLVKGVGVMSQSHSSGAYFVHLQMDKLTSFTISESDLENIKAHIFKTAGANVGNSIIKSDNSGASRIFADGGFTSDVYADGGQIRVGDRYKFNWTDTKGNKGYTIREVVKQNVTSSKDFKTKVIIMKVVESSMPEQVGRLEEEYKPSFKKAIERGMEIPMHERMRKLTDENYAKGGNLTKYINHSNIKTVTVNRNGKEVTYKGDDVLNGANVLEEGGDLTSKANYIPKRDVVSVELKDGTNVKPANGYWVKKGAEPISSKQEFTSKDLPKNGSEIYINAPAMSGAPAIDLVLKYDSKNFRFDVYKDGVKKDMIGEKEVLNNLNSGIYVLSSIPTPTSSSKSEPKISTTEIRKDPRGNWRAETTIDNFNGYDWRISTVKTYSGNLVSSAQGGKTEPTGTKGYSMFKYTMYEDPNHTLEVSKPTRLTEKVVSEQHEKALAKFKKFMETGMFKGGGKISNFDKLSAKVAKEYEGKPVKSKYQEEYGKYYSKEEAQEVGDKVAGKIKSIKFSEKTQQANKGIKVENSGTNMLKEANALAKKIRKDGESWNDAKKRAFAQLKK